MKVVSLFYYPVKSMQGIPLTSATIDDFGFVGDRRYMLIDEQGRFVTQRKNSVLSAFQAQLIDKGVSITAGNKVAMVFPLSEFTESMQASVWDDQVEVLIIPFDKMSDISAVLGFNVTLAYMPDSSYRQVDRAFFNAPQRVGFADAFPFLLTSMASLEDLNSRLEHAIGMSRFRPNIVIDGVHAFEEDQWQEIRIGDVVFKCVKPCSRCVMTTIDENGNTGQEPLKTLASYRKNSFGVCFGENLVHLSPGMIHVGDEVEILK